MSAPCRWGIASEAAGSSVGLHRSAGIINQRARERYAAAGRADRLVAIEAALADAVSALSGGPGAAGSDAVPVIAMNASPVHPASAMRSARV